jgi:phosphatidylglycerophosphate synthase
MPSKFRIRYIFKPIITSMAKILSKIGVTPNIATIIMLAFAIISFIILVFFQNLILFSFCVFLTGIMDGCDGAIARLTNNSTKFGGFFDSMMDRISEFFIFLALLIYCWTQSLWNFLDMKLIILLSFLTSIMISYLRTRAENFVNGDFSKRDFDVGLMARSERLFYIFISAIISFFFGFFNELLFIFMFLLIGTAIFRFTRINTQLKKQELQKNLEIN